MMIEASVDSKIADLIKRHAEDPFQFIKFTEDDVKIIIHSVAEAYIASQKEHNCFLFVPLKNKTFILSAENLEDGSVGVTNSVIATMDFPIPQPMLSNQIVVDIDKLSVSNKSELDMDTSVEAFGKIELNLLPNFPKEVFNLIESAL